MQTVHLLRKYNPAQWGGTETAVQRLFDGLRHHGVTPIVYCPQLNSSPELRQEPDPLCRAGYQVRRFRAFLPVWGLSDQRRRQLVSLGGNLMSFDLIPTLWRQKKLDLIHTHTLGRIGGIALTIAKQRNLPLVVTIHGGVLDLPPGLKEEFHDRSGPGWEWGRFFGLIFRSHRVLRDADAILTCNQNEARLLREQLPSQRIEVQPHGVPLDVYSQDHREAALNAFPRISGRQVLLCVGRIDPVKNQAWLVEQSAAIAQTFPRALLVLAGSCTDENYGKLLEQNIGRLGLQEHVLITGGLPPNDPRLVGLLQSAQVLVVPSQSETFGLVILEAWAAGTLVVSSRTSGANALICDGQNGWLFDLQDPGTFHKALALALGKPEAARTVMHSGNEEVRRRYDVRALAGKMKKLYGELINEKNARRHYS